MQQEANALEAPEEIKPKGSEAQHEQTPEETKPNGKDTKADAESGSNADELNGASGAEDERPEQVEEKEPDEEKRQKKQRARERIQQVVAQRKEAEARARSAEKEVERLKAQIQAPGEDATQEEIDAYNLRKAIRAEKMEDVSQEAQTSIAAARESRKALFEAKVEASSQPADVLDKFYALQTVSEHMADFISESDRAAEIANYLGSNPHKAQEIHRLPANRQVSELARLEVRLSTAPQVKKTTTAPKPPPVLKGSSGSQSKSIEQMSEAEYFKWRSRKKD